ncbi:Sin-like protein conserved region-domain-containing protein [Geopyxis carbonaria]|nr:Sin-like protein conserved region-domain-containing protein [Geopyxis carbonaria]
MPPRITRATRTKANIVPSEQITEPVTDKEDIPLFPPGLEESDDEGEPSLPAPLPVVIPTGADSVASRVEISDDSDHSEDEDAGYESENDPVVRSYDVYMTSELAQYLYLFQYPVRSGSKPYTKINNSCPVGARFKPKSGLVELDVPVNVAVNFDEEKGRVWGEVLRKAKAANEGGLAGKANFQRGGKRRKMKDDDEEEEEEDSMYQDFGEAVKKGRILNKQTLGSKIHPDETKYMVGVFKNDQLHLTPIISTLQLRPQFLHVDAQGAQDRAANKALRDADQPERPSEARAVHMSVKNTADPAAQMSSTMKALRMAEGEEWKHIHWVDQDNDEAWDQYELLSLEESKQETQLRCQTSKNVYMDFLSGAALQKTEGK